MKIQLTIVALSLTAAYTGLSQGEVQFDNSSQTKISVNTSAAQSTFAAITGAGAYYFALYNSVAATTVSGSGAAVVATPTVPGTYAYSDSNWTFDSYGVSAASLGRFAATGLDTAGFTQIPGEPANTQFVVIGWSANIGSTIAALQSFFAGTDVGVTSGFVGESAVSGSLSTGAAGTQNAPASIFAGAAPYVTPFDLGYTTATVPEPTSIALAGLGGLSLLAFRRKKA